MNTKVSSQRKSKYEGPIKKFPLYVPGAWHQGRECLGLGLEGLGEASFTQGARECFFRGNTAATQAGRL